MLRVTKADLPKMLKKFTVKDLKEIIEQKTGKPVNKKPKSNKKPKTNILDIEKAMKKIDTQHHSIQSKFEEIQQRFKRIQKEYKKT